MSTGYPYLKKFGLHKVFTTRYVINNGIDHAEAILKSLYEAAPVVIRETKPNTHESHFVWRVDDGGYDSRFFDKRAKLICIEEIKPKECRHEPMAFLDVSEYIKSGYTTDPIKVVNCVHCNKRLKAKWS